MYCGCKVGHLQSSDGKHRLYYIATATENVLQNSNAARCNKKTNPRDLGGIASRLEDSRRSRSSDACAPPKETFYTASEKANGNDLATSRLCQLRFNIVACWRSRTRVSGQYI